MWQTGAPPAFRPESPWSPLRPKNIGSALAAAADASSAANWEAPGGRGGHGEAQQVSMPAAPIFELPDNVSRRPSTVEAHAAPARRRRQVGLTGDGGHASANGAKVQRKKLKMRPLSGPERAAARKRRQQLAKKAVSRRVALWRSRIVDGEKQVVYVSLSGEVLQKNGRAFRAATADQKYLKARGIVSFRPSQSSIEVPEDLQPYCLGADDPLELSYWCIPESVQAGYRDAGVRRLHKWQAECLSSPQVLNGRSLVYVAPTSAGKSLVSEVIMLRQLLFRGRRSLLVLPYVSIVAERVQQLRRIWGACGLRLEALHGSSEDKWHAGADVAVCTIEKASSLLNKLLEDDALLKDIGVVVIDEMHLLGEEHRGYLLELILLKARLSAELAAPAGTLSGHEGSSLQIVGLSATLPNVRTLADWLGAHLYICNERPVPLSLCVASKGQVLHSDHGQLVQAEIPGIQRRSRDPDGVTPLVWECVSAGQSVLVFCATKDWCEKAAAMLAEELKNLEEESRRGDSKSGSRLQLLEELRQAPTGLCQVLAKTVPQGVAYHHAGLTVEERSLLEDAYRNGTLSCLCSTATLAAGVNLPARRVIIRSMKVGSQTLDAVRFRQMAGRAGRVGLESKGECIVVAKSSRDAEEAQALFSAELLPLRSALNGQRLARAVLEVVSLGLVRSVNDLEGRFARSLLRYYEDRPGAWNLAEALVPPLLLEDIRLALTYLEERQLVRVDVAAASVQTRAAIGQSLPNTGHPPTAPAAHPPEATLLSTPLGDGVVHSSLKPDEALSVFEDLQRSRKGLCLDTDLHLIFLATPALQALEPDWSRFLAFYERLKPRDRAVASAVGVSHEFLLKQSMGHRGPISSCTTPGMDWRQDRERVTLVHRRFWTALALRELAGEASPSRVASTFSAPRGALQSLQGHSATYCGMVRQLCERLRWHEMAALFDCLMPRLSFGVASEGLELCRIPGVYPARARAFLDAGLTTVEAVAKSSTSKIEALLRSMAQFESHCTDAEVARHQEVVVRQVAQRIVRGAQDRLGQDFQNLEDEAEEEQRRIRRALSTRASPAARPP